MKTSKIFQHNTYTTLYGGFYEGTITAGEVLKHGLNGIGTLDGADGEVIILNGHVYHGSNENQSVWSVMTKRCPMQQLLNIM